MLNRLYIVVGVLAILILGAAFIVPGLIPWSNYRGRMEMLASQALGTDVRINGDIGFSLLPAPHLILNNLSVGPAQQPVIAIGSADADFSLIDFLRDRYTMTRLVLDHPVLALKIKADGTLDSGLKPAGADSNAAVSVADAQIDVGTLKVSDAGSGRTYQVDGIDGTVTLGALRGPFGFSGGGSLGDQHYTFRLTSERLDAAGKGQLSLFAQPDGNGNSVDLEGTLATAGVPHFTGDLTYRQAPPKGKDANGVVGDLTFVSKVDATARQIGLPAFTLIPDENRGVVRLAGSGKIELGAAPSFSAIVASGVLALPPRDATAETGPQPYELVRLLGEIPVLPVPPIPGTISATADEIDLRSFALRNVTLEAAAVKDGWSIKSLAGDLPGNATIKLAGVLGAPDGRPSFAGTVAIAADRLDALAALWRKPAADNPLFAMPGSFGAKVSLLGQTMALTDGQLRLDGVSHSLTALVKFGAKPRVDLSGQFTQLSDEDSAAVLALVPDFASDPGAAVTFPEGAVSLAADSATIFGLKAQKLALEGKWGNGSVELSKLSADDLGGAKLDLALTLAGTLEAPKIAGKGEIDLAASGGPAFNLLLGQVGAPVAVRQLLQRSLPATLDVRLDDPDNGGAQGLSLSGKAGVADLTLIARLGGGIAKALAAPIEASLNLSSNDATGLTAQLGLGDVGILPETGGLELTASLKGTPTGTLGASLALAGGGDSMSFDGKLTPGDLSAPSADGAVKLSLADTSALASDLGIAGLYTPAVKGTAELHWGNDGGMALDNIAAASGATGFSGKLALAHDAKGGVVSGDLTIDSLDVTALLATIGSPTALMTSTGKLWPDGPIAAGDAPRSTTGSISIETPAISRGGQPFLTDAGFDLSWDATQAAIHKFAAKLDGGDVTLDATLCCTGQAADKQLSAEATIAKVPLSAVLPPAAAATLSGTLDGSVRVTGTGDSADALLAGLGGDGSFSVTGLSIAKLDPAAFASVAATGNIVDLDAKTLGDKFATALDQGGFASPRINGGFTISNGTLRIPNLAADTAAARLFGSATVKLADLSLGGGFALTPVGTLDAGGLVSETTSKVTANLSGTLLAPVRTLDIADMVEAIKVKALENEVARLESLKAQDDARAKAFAQANKEATEDEEAQQLANQQAAAAKAKADAAAKQAAADAAAQAATDAAAQEAATDAAAQQAADVAAQQAADAAATEAADAAAAKQAAAAAAAKQAAKQAADAAAAKQAAARRAAAARQQSSPPPMDLGIPFFRPMN